MHTHSRQSHAAGVRCAHAARSVASTQLYVTSVKMSTESTSVSLLTTRSVNSDSRSMLTGAYDEYQPPMTDTPIVSQLAACAAHIPQHNASTTSAAILCDGASPQLAV